MTPDELYKKLNEGYAEMQAQRKMDEDAKPPALRGGNSGALLEDGTFIGDPRAAVLRYMGVEGNPSFDTNLLFQAGLFNEDAIAELMDAGGIKYLREEECPVSWTTSNGFLVTGRPDAMILNDSSMELDDPEAEFTGKEYKGLFSSWSALKQSHFGYGTPKDIYVCQAAHYFYKTDRKVSNWIIQFTSRSHTNFFCGMDKLLDPTHRALKINDKGKVMGAKPFTSFYNLTKDEEDGTILLDGERTVIDEAAIERFYEYVGDCINNREIPKVTKACNIWGESIPLKEFNKFWKCPEDASSWEQWLIECQKIMEEED